MARKRMLDPGIWTNVQVARLSVLQRLLYIGLISNADDDGRLNGDPTYIKGVVFPHDNITVQAIEDALKQIARGSLIVRYRANKSWYIQHPNWGKFQYIRDRRPSTIPPPKGPTIPSTIPSTLKQQQQSPIQSSSIQHNTVQDNPEINLAKAYPLLLSVGVTRSEASVLASTFSYARIISICQCARGKDNPAGFIVSALKGNWTVENTKEVKQDEVQCVR